MSCLPRTSITFSMWRSCILFSLPETLEHAELLIMRLIGAPNKGASFILATGDNRICQTRTCCIRNLTWFRKIYVRKNSRATYTGDCNPLSAFLTIYHSTWSMSKFIKIIRLLDTYRLRSPAIDAAQAHRTWRIWTQDTLPQAGTAIFGYCHLDPLGAPSPDLASAPQPGMGEWRGLRNAGDSDCAAFNAVPMPCGSAHPCHARSCPRLCDISSGAVIL